MSTIDTIPPAFGLPEHDARVELLRSGPIAGMKTAAKVAAGPARAWLIENGLASEWPPAIPPPVRATAAPLDAQGLPRSDREKQVYENHEHVAALRAPRAMARLLTVSVDDIVEEDEEWLWPGRIPLGTVTVILGRMGDGKSTLTGWLAAQVSAGRSWPDCPDDNEAGSVLILQAEESRSRSIKPRLLKFDYGRGKVHVIKGVDRGDGQESWFSLAADVEMLAAECDRIGDVRLIIVDPLGSYIRGANGNNEPEMRAYFQPLFTLAEEKDLSIVAVTHPNKDSDKDILDRSGGSGAIVQMARVSWYFSEDPNDKSRRLISLMKGNPTTTTRTAIALHYDGRKGRMTWFTDPIKLNAREVDHLLQKEAREAKLNTRRGPDPTESKRAEEFLLKQLGNGPLLQSSAQDLALNEGIKESSFLKGMKRLVRSDGRVRREKGKKDGRWWLHLDALPAEPSDPDTGGTEAEADAHANPPDA